MVAGPQRHYGAHNFHLGELRKFRTEIFPTLAAANAESAQAQARLIYIVETQTAYFGRPGAWIPFGGTTLGGGVLEVSDPFDLDSEYTAFSLNILSSDDVNDTITVDVTPAGVLDDVESGDQLVVSGSADNSAVPWLDGTYDIVSLDTVTGVIQLPAGTVPAVPNSPVSTYGTGEFQDQTFPASGTIAVVNPSPETGGPAIYVYDGGTAAWDNHNSLDGRIVFRDGSRTFLVLPITDQIENPTDPQQLIRYGYLLNQLAEIVLGAFDLTDIDSTGANTVFTFLSDDSYSFTAGDELVVDGHGPADGTYTLTNVVVTPGSPDTFEAEIDSNLAIDDASPAGTASIKRPGSGIPTRADLATIGGDLTAHINDAGDPHSAAGYIKQPDADAAAATAVATHEADSGDPHAAADYQKGSEVDATIATHDADQDAHGAAFSKHNSDSSAHNGLIAQIQSFLLGSSSATLSGIVLGSQVVDPNAAFSEPLFRDPDNGMWKVRTADTDPVHGVAVESSEVIEKYGDVAGVVFSSAGVTLPAAIVDEFIPGQLLRFPGSASNPTTIFRIERYDPAVPEFILSPAPVAEASFTTAIERFTPFGSVSIAGTLPIPNGGTVLPAVSALRYDVDFDRITLDVDEGELDHIVPGMIAVVSGSTDNDGTYTIASLGSAIESFIDSIFLEPKAVAVLTGASVQTITVATKTIVFDVGDDLTVVSPGDELTLDGTTDNDGVYTVDTVDDGTKTVTVIEAMPGADQGAAAGTGDFVNPSTNPLPGTQHPALQTFVSGASITNIDVDDGSSEAVFTLGGSPDLSLVLPGDSIIVSGADDPDHDGSWEISSVDDGLDTVNIINTLPGVDQTTTGGTADIEGDRPSADGTVTIQNDLKVNNFDTSIATVGDKFYADAADPEGYSKTVHDWRIGWQTTPEEFIVSIEEETAQNPVPPEEWTTVSEFSATPPLDEYSGGTFNAIPDWTASTAYSLGDFVKPTTPNGFVYEAVVAGTSDSSEPAFGTTLGGDTVDNTVTWRARQLAVIETTADLTGSINVGDPVRYSISSTFLYGIVVAINATRIAVAGAPIATTDTIESVDHGEANRVVQLRFSVGGAYGDAVEADLLASDNLSPFRWAAAQAALVDASVIHQTADTTSDPSVNVNLAGSAVLSEESSNGLSPALTWVDNPLGSILSAAYLVSLREALTLEVTVAGGTGDASDLTVMFTFVIP